MFLPLLKPTQACGGSTWLSCLRETEGPAGPVCPGSGGTHPRLQGCAAHVHPQAILQWSPSSPQSTLPGPEEASKNTCCQAQMTKALQGRTTCSGFGDGLGRQNREQSVLTTGISCRTLGPPGRAPGGHTVQPHHCLRPAALLPTIGCGPEGGGRGELAARREALTQVQEVRAAGRGRSTVGRREGWWDGRGVRIEKFAEEIRMGAGLGVAVCRRQEWAKGVSCGDRRAQGGLSLAA